MEIIWLTLLPIRELNEKQPIKVHLFEHLIQNYLNQRDICIKGKKLLIGHKTLWCFSQNWQLNCVTLREGLENILLPLSQKVCSIHWVIPKEIWTLPNSCMGGKIAHNIYSHKWIQVNGFCLFITKFIVALPKSSWLTWALGAFASLWNLNVQPKII